MLHAACPDVVRTDWGQGETGWQVGLVGLVQQSSSTGLDSAKTDLLSVLPGLTPALKLAMESTQEV